MVWFWDTRQKKTTLLSSVSYDIHIFYPSASKLCEMLTQDQFRSHSEQQMHISGDVECVFPELQKCQFFYMVMEQNIQIKFYPMKSG